jgi:hypothetical protein
MSNVVMEYLTSLPTLGNTQKTQLKSDVNGRLLVSSAEVAASATGLLKLEDAVAASGDAGVMALAVRADTAAATGANGDYVPLLTDSLGKLHTNIAGRGLSASAAFTPAAANHVAGDSFGTAGTFALGAPSGATIKINSVSLRIDGGTAETTAWILYLFSVTPPSALADDAAFVLASGDRASFLGKVDIAQTVDVGDTLFQEAQNVNKQVTLAGTGLFGYLVNGTALTPQAVAHNVTINAEVI